jgi:hypothetical protein
MSNFPILSDTGCLTTCALAQKPIGTGALQHFAGSDENLPNCTARSTDIAASDWRDEAIARGRAAYEIAVAEPPKAADLLSWLWRPR